MAHRLKFVQLCYGSLFLTCPEDISNLSQHFAIKNQVALQLFHRTLDILLCPPLVFDVELFADLVCPTRSLSKRPTPCFPQRCGNEREMFCDVLKITIFL